MRVILFLLIVLVVALLIAVGTGLIGVTQTRTAQAPNVSVNTNGVAARGGQSPAFDIETGSVAVGTKDANVTVPTVKVVPPAGEANQAAPANTAQ
jgi:hypothetical protein